jgi:hypothetical protein
MRTVGAVQYTLKYQVTMFDLNGNPTFTKQFPTIESIVAQINLSNMTIRRMLKGTSSQPFLQITKI